MELAIDFEEVVEAFEESDVMHHFVIDTKNTKLISINEDLDEDAKHLEKMVGDRYLMIPPRFPEDDFLVMELFVCEKIHDDVLAEKFHHALKGVEPFGTFKDLLADNPNLREQWFTYYHEHLKNQAINWLCDNNIELTDQRLIPAIKIRELTKGEINGLTDEIKNFSPVKCMNCQNEQGLVKRLFLINISPENTLIEQETKQIMEEKFNITHYGWWSGETPNILTVSRCPKCHSEHIIWDY